jgi:hypothetical protein
MGHPAAHELPVNVDLMFPGDTLLDDVVLDDYPAKRKRGDSDGIEDVSSKLKA